MYITTLSEIQIRDGLDIVTLRPGTVVEMHEDDAKPFVPLHAREATAEEIEVAHVRVQEIKRTPLVAEDRDYGLTAARNGARRLNNRVTPEKLAKMRAEKLERTKADLAKYQKEVDEAEAASEKARADAEAAVAKKALDVDSK